MPSGFHRRKVLVRSNAWRIARQQQVNMHEVRLLFRWPIDSAASAGNQRQVFRTLVGGH